MLRKSDSPVLRPEHPHLLSNAPDHCRQKGQKEYKSWKGCEMLVSGYATINATVISQQPRLSSLDLYNIGLDIS